MATTKHSITIHGSTVLGISEVFCCSRCFAPVAVVMLPGGDEAYECISPRCGKTVSVQCPEVLALVDAVALALPARRFTTPIAV